MKWLQQRKIVIVGEEYYALPTLLMKEGSKRRRRLLIALMLKTIFACTFKFQVLLSHKTHSRVLLACLLPCKHFASS